MPYRKLNKPSDQRRALLRNQVTALLWYGKIETTVTRAKEVQAISEKLITLAMSECDSNVMVTKKVKNDKGQIVELEVRNDSPAKLHVRRQLMAYLYEIPEAQKDDESKSEYKKRTHDIKHPVIEKLFNEVAPKYKKRAEEKKQGGGYTRILRKGPRRGDAAEMVILEMI